MQKNLERVWATYIRIQVFISSPKLPEWSPAVSAHANITPKYRKQVEVNRIFFLCYPKLLLILLPKKCSGNVAHQKCCSGKTLEWPTGPEGQIWGQRKVSWIVLQQGHNNNKSTFELMKQTDRSRGAISHCMAVVNDINQWWCKTSLHTSSSLWGHQSIQDPELSLFDRLPTLLNLWPDFTSDKAWSLG